MTSAAYTYELEVINPLQKKLDDANYASCKAYDRYCDLSTEAEESRGKSKRTAQAAARAALARYERLSKVEGDLMDEMWEVKANAPD